MPSLDRPQLDAALIRLELLNLDRASKDTIADILRAASNPDGERVDVVIKTLPQERRTNVERTARRVQSVTKAVTSRAGAALRDMSEEEWAALVGSADDGD